MATKKFTDFAFQAPINNSDFLVGYKADGSTEIRTPVDILLSKINLTEISNTSGSWNSTTSTVRANSAQWAVDNSSDLAVRALTGKYESSYTTVNANSAQWATDTNSDLAVRALTGDWANTFTTVNANSAQWATDTNSDLAVRGLTGRYESTFTTVNTLSSGWNYQGTDIKVLTSNWESTYNNVYSNSASWNHGNRYIPLSGGVLTGTLSANSIIVASLTALSAYFLVAETLSAESLVVTGLSSVNTIVVPGVDTPRVQLSIGRNWNLVNTNNSTDSIIQWNQIDYITNTTYFSASTANRNIQILQPGYYTIEIRYASYDLLNAQNFLRVQLRSSTSGVINTGNGGNLIGTVEQGYIGTTVNGEAMKSGVLSISANAAPLWLVATMLHNGATGGGGLNQGYPVFNNLFGTQPYIIVERKTELPL